MSFLRKLFGGDRRSPPPAGATPGQLLDLLEERRAAVEPVLLARHPICPQCESDYLRVGAWAKGSPAGWTVTCVNCGAMLEKTTEIT